MQVSKVNKRSGLVHAGYWVLAVLFLTTSGGCQRMGVKVAKLLPAKKAKAAAAAPAESTEDQGANAGAGSADLGQNMGSSSAGGPAFDDPNEDLTSDMQNYGNGEDMELPEGDSTFDDISGEGAMQAEQLDDGPPADLAGGLLGDYAGGSGADPGAGEATSGAIGDTPGGFGDPSATPGLTNEGPAGGNNRSQGGARRGKPNGQRNSAADLRKLKVQPPPPKPVYRLTENAILPVMTKEGQRVGFSVRYQLQKGEMSPKAQYGLVIESGKSGKFGLPARLGEEGVLQVPAVPAFRPDSGPFKAYLIELKSRGPQTISNEVKFNPKF